MLEPPDHNTKSHPHADRRQSVRICCACFVEGVSDEPGHLFRGEIHNVSETGCFVSLRAPLTLPPGSRMQLRFKMGHAHYHALARVIEALPSTGMRMQFIATDPAFTNRIRHILSSNADAQ
jgi:hypothetical protein